MTCGLIDGWFGMIVMLCCFVCSACCVGRVVCWYLILV